MRSSTSVGLAAARGRFTSMPRYIIGAVSMKISSSTRTTSTSGMMLISASAEPPCRLLAESSLNAIADCHAVDRPSSDRTAQQIEKIEREAIHFDEPVAYAGDEIVIANDGWDRRRETGGGGDQGFGNTGCDDREARRSLAAAAVERRHP